MNGFTSATSEVNGIALHYVRGGSGPTLLLVHGFRQDWYEWRGVMSRLAATFTVIAVDLRGVGGSDAPDDGYDAATMADDLHDLGPIGPSSVNGKPVGPGHTPGRQRHRRSNATPTDTSLPHRNRIG